MDQNRSHGKHVRYLRAPLTIAIMLAPLAAQAYVGPGAGLSLLGALWGVIAAIGAALLFVVLWPLRRMMRRRRETAERQSRPDDTAPGAEPHDRSKSSHHS